MGLKNEGAGDVEKQKKPRFGGLVGNELWLMSCLRVEV